MRRASSGQDYRRRTDNTDFRGLVPGQYARHPGRGSEREAMGEGSGIPRFPPTGDGFSARDVRRAAWSKLNTKGGRSK